MHISRFFTIVALLCVTHLHSQEIKSNTVDPFTSERTVETTLVPIKQGLSSGFGISYMAVNNSYYLTIIGYKSNSFTIAETDKVWMVLEDGNVIQFNERAVGENENGDEKKNLFIYHYFATMNDIEIMKNKKVAIVRIATADGTLNDIHISAKLAKKVQKLHEVFFNEVNKAASF